MFVRIYVLEQYTLFLGQFSKILEDWRMWSLRRERVFPPSNLLIWILHLKSDFTTWNHDVIVDYTLKYMCYNEIWLYAQTIDTILGSVVDKFGGSTQKERMSSPLIVIIQIFHLKCDFETWNHNLFDSWLLPKRDNSRSNPTAIASAHNAATMPIVPTCVIIMRFDCMLKL